MKNSERYYRNLLKRAINETLDSKADKLMDRIKNGETGGMNREHVNFFFGQKFNEILVLNSNSTDNDFERVIGKVDCC